MNRKSKYLLVAALFTGCFLVSGCENDIREIQKYTQKKTAIEEARNVETYLSQDGKMKAKLTSPFMLRYLPSDSPYVEFPRTLHVDFFNDSTKIESQLDALYGKYREWEKKVFLRDSVVVINRINGDTLYAPELWWDQNTEKIFTDKPVRIHTRENNKIIHGQFGLIASQDFNEYVIFNAAGQINVPKDSVP